MSCFATQSRPQSPRVFTVSGMEMRLSSLVLTRRNAASWNEIVLQPRKVYLAGFFNVIKHLESRGILEIKLESSKVVGIYIHFTK